MAVLDLSWTEKYRPSKLSEVIGQGAIVERLQTFVDAKNFPNMIFSGTAGVGKTTCAIAMAKELYKEKINEAFLELNASVTPDTPILIKYEGNVERTTMGELASRHFASEDEKYAYPYGVEILSIDKEDLKVKFMPVENISRHSVDRVLDVKVEGGGVSITESHSAIIIDEKGELQSIKASELKKGDLLITFNTVLDSNKEMVDLSEYGPNEFIHVTHGGQDRLMRNPKIRTVVSTMKITPEIAWLFGSYTAEGAIGFRGNTSGIAVFTYAYPKESQISARSASIISQIGFPSHEHLIRSGTSKRWSAVQLTVSSTQIARFLKNNFYQASAESKNAHSKKIPNFIFSTPKEHRHAFLQGYMGDAWGIWGKNYIRYCSVSTGLLIDTIWLARISGLESWLFDREARIAWYGKDATYTRSNLLPMQPVEKLFCGMKEVGFNWRYEMRHQLYHKKAVRIKRESVKELLDKIGHHMLSEESGLILENIKRLANSDMSVLKITGITPRNYNGYVYDVSVPGSEMFWGGTIPILLHNSDTRGIDVIRGKVKEFARTIALSGDMIKIIFLDEADALTPEAQHALRRTMEKYSATTRFILSANYASKIIEPIQSRCVVLRFKPLNEEDMRKYIKRVAKGEGIEVDDKAVEALLYVSEGDLRKLTNILQSAGFSRKKVTDKEIYDIAARARPKEVAVMLRCALSGDFMKARDELNQLVLSYGMSGEDILLQCYREALTLDVPDKVRLKLISAIGDYNFRIVEGANDRIQLEAMLARFALLEKEKA